MFVHTSVIDEHLLTNQKFFLYNNLNYLKNILKYTQEYFRTKMVIVDCIYSKAGDIAPLDNIRKLTKTLQCIFSCI